ncbi:MAG: response regulator [candidate division Zixibacteria bacterium]|nr:response regulator [candidate division Zixibacteria bacterium]
MAITTRPKRKLRIMVVDDDLDLCDYLTDLLTEEGYEVDAFQSPNAALDKLKNKVYHIILLDLKMAEMNGVDVLRSIRKFDSDICVIILTAYPAVDTAVETMKQDAFDYIKKPFDNEELKEIIERAIQSKGLVVDISKKVCTEIGSRVKELRKKKNLTLKQLANRAGLSVSLISQIERAESAASIATLTKVSAALNTKMETFFKGI